MKFVKDHFHSANKSLARTLMVESTTMKFAGSYSMQEHIIEITYIAARFKIL